MVKKKGAAKEEAATEEPPQEKKKAAGKKVKAEPAKEPPRNKKAAKGDASSKPAAGAAAGAAGGSKDALAAEAIEAVLEGIANPMMQNNGKAFIPKDWSTKYKEVLGPYKKWLSEHPDTFTLVQKDACNFIVVKAGEKPPEGNATQVSPWQKEVLKAWMEYCKATAKPERDFAAFVAAIPVGKSAGKPVAKDAAPTTPAKGVKRKAGDAEKPSGKKVKKSK